MQINSLMVRVFLFGSFLILCLSGRAQFDKEMQDYLPKAHSKDTTIIFYAQAPDSVTLGQTFTLSLIIDNANDSVHLILPILNDFDKMGEPVTTTVLNFTQGNQTKQMKYNYCLKAKRVGNCKIPKITFQIGQLIVTTDELAIQVIADGNVVSSSPNSPLQIINPGCSNNELKDSIIGAPNQHVIYQLNVDRDSAYQGEIIFATYKLYFDLSIDSLRILDLPDFKDFLCKEVELNPRRQPVTVNFKGRKHEEVDLEKFSLYSLSHGVLNLSSMGLHAAVKIPDAKRGNLYDDFFQIKKFTSTTVNLKAQSVSVFIKELPKKDMPGAFKGAVGNFKVETVSSSKNKKFHPGDKISFTITINGTGNLESINAPEIKLPPLFQMLKPKTYTSDSVDEHVGLTGSRQFKYTCIANEAGNFNIGEVSFSYFDPKKEKYISQTQPGFMVTVTKGE